MKDAAKPVRVDAIKKRRDSLLKTGANKSLKPNVPCSKIAKTSQNIYIIRNPTMAPHPADLPGRRRWDELGTSKCVGKKINSQATKTTIPEQIAITIRLLLSVNPEKRSLVYCGRLYSQMATLQATQPTSIAKKD